MTNRLKLIAAAAIIALGLSGCIIIVDGDDDDKVRVDLDYTSQ